MHRLRHIQDKGQVAAILGIVSCFRRHFPLKVLAVYPDVRHAHHALELNIKLLSLIGFRQLEMLPVHRFSLIIHAAAVVIRLHPYRVGQVYALPPLQLLHRIIHLNGLLDVLSHKLPALVKIQLFRRTFRSRNAKRHKKRKKKHE